MESNKTNTHHNMVIMECRHCIRYALGHCTRHGGTPPTWREPLYLRMGDGRKTRLVFDCEKCQMNLCV